MSEHSHEWLEQMFVFPDGEDGYEHDQPYLVEYCADRECGHRRTRLMTTDQIDEVRDTQGYAPTGNLGEEVSTDG